MNGSGNHNRFPFWAGRLLVVQCVIMFLLVPATASAQSSGTNLLQNGGNDLPLVGGEIPGWTEVQGAGWTQRSANPPPHSGPNYFFAGTAGVAELLQDVDLTQFSAEIEARAVAFEFRGLDRKSVV